MTRRVDLNADLGEGFGPWEMGDDAALMEVITSANIACGFHAGDPCVMAHAMAVARAKNVQIGAHPGFADLQGFGRREIQMSPSELRPMLQYQIGAAQALAKAAGGAVGHVKLHGALSNMAARDLALARCCFEAVLDIAPDMVLLVQAETAMHHAAKELGCAYASEIYADRGYGEDGTLLPRAQPGAVLHDPDMVVARVVDMLRESAIITAKGTRLATDIDSVCLHGDSPGAVAMAQALAGRLPGAGIAIKGFSERRLT
ncbi:MAG: 5-oxoprolinase subunit PxpA [Mangrovicoccus sp.]|nr:5-oxoprolinase subunit PxpA [Mangrovicoccus sp.]